ncbi:hypothetical protein CLOACE_07650 [Clostridium acetireducens DSM 10703]|jgi:hypothetical protein|uniref:DUF3793 domain-containing protein n=1 Tax=Clostridium acetireducens DSM 10703 TaxID=1121290 RepID=A0A1E8F022_9CLOT|nr:DUF3793 family protein [Clostridium acetireducens]OFI06782.1 hypothetical protein CLOACE_07650 [Clostridium acetireducens DSM 10703]
MSKHIISRFINTISKKDDKEYLFAILLYFIAPTIHGVKPSTIVTLKHQGRNLNSLWNKHKEEFKNSYNVEFYEIKSDNESTTILFYHLEELTNTLKCNENLVFLNKFGYTEDMTVEECIEYLKSRFDFNGCPHEMGIFLGIPIEDVITFMENPDKKCVMCGYWKVFNNVEKARKKFYDYDKSKIKIIRNILSSDIETYSV